MAWHRERFITIVECYWPPQYYRAYSSYQAPRAVGFCNWCESDWRSESLCNSYWVPKWTPCTCSLHIIYDLTVKERVSLFDPTFIDTILSAENSAEHHSLPCQIVLKHNIHNFWGQLNLSAVCMITNYCPKQFTKDLVNETDHDEAQLYVTYRQRSPDFGVQTAL